MPGDVIDTCTNDHDLSDGEGNDDLVSTSYGPEHQYESAAGFEGLHGHSMRTEIILTISKSNL